MILRLYNINKFFSTPEIMVKWGKNRCVKLHIHRLYKAFCVLDNTFFIYFEKYLWIKYVCLFIFSDELRKTKIYLLSILLCLKNFSIEMWLSV